MQRDRKSLGCGKWTSILGADGKYGLQDLRVRDRKNAQEEGSDKRTTDYSVATAEEEIHLWPERFSP